MCCHSERADGDFLLVRLLLAIDGLALRAHHVSRLKRTLLLQHAAGQLIALGVLRDESQVHTRNQVVDTHVQRSLHGVNHLLTVSLQGGP